MQSMTGPWPDNHGEKMCLGWWNEFSGPTVPRCLVTVLSGINQSSYIKSLSHSGRPLKITTYSSCTLMKLLITTASLSVSSTVASGFIEPVFPSALTFCLFLCLHFILHMSSSVSIKREGDRFHFEIIWIILWKWITSLHSNISKNDPKRSPATLLTYPVAS